MKKNNGICIFAIMFLLVMCFFLTLSISSKHYGHISIYSINPIHVMRQVVDSFDGEADRFFYNRVKTTHEEYFELCTALNIWIDGEGNLVQDEVAEFRNKYHKELLRKIGAYKKHKEKVKK